MDRTTEVSCLLGMEVWSSVQPESRAKTPRAEGLRGGVSLLRLRGMPVGRRHVWLD